MIYRFSDLGLLGLLCGSVAGCATVGSGPTATQAEATSSALPPSPVQPPEGVAPVVPLQARDFELETLNGELIRLSEVQRQGGKLILLSFWSTWCEPCKDELPHLERLQQELQGQGLRILAVAVDSAATLSELRSYVRSRNLALTVPLDPDRLVIDQYNPKMILPFWVLIDEQNRVVRSHQGYLPGDEQVLEQEIRSRLVPRGSPGGAGGT